MQGQTLPQGLTGLLSPNTLLGGRYTIVRKLGKGGMGAVYLVADGRLVGKMWAVKEMSDAALLDPVVRQSAVQAFQREATLLAALNHANLTKVVDYFEEQGKHFLVMDYVEGETLAEKLDGCSVPFSEKDVMGWAEQLCDVLNYLHEQNPPIIFRDLKPGNIMVDKQGKVKLIDFGVARNFKPGVNKDTVSLGTPGYAAPEQYGKGQSDVRSDVYALGATLHHLLTLRDPGDEPFKFPPVTRLNPSVSNNVELAIGIAVQQDPGIRWQTAAEFATELHKKDPVNKPTVAASPPVRRVVMVNPPPIQVPAVQSVNTPAYPVQYGPRPVPTPPAPVNPVIGPADAKKYWTSIVIGVLATVAAAWLMPKVFTYIYQNLSPLPDWFGTASSIISGVIYTTIPLIILQVTRRPGIFFFTAGGYLLFMYFAFGYDQGLANQ